MAKTKTMNENSFSKLAKELSALAELVRTRQEEKQSVIDEFEKERGRYKTGKISENTLASSVKKTNLELIKLDNSIRETIQKAVNLSTRMQAFLRSQSPKAFRAKESGFFMLGGKKKTSKKKPASTKKVVTKKPAAKSKTTAKKKPATKKKAPVKKKVPVKKKSTGKKKAKISKSEIQREIKAEKKLLK
jgi:hypothetical protein